MNSLEKYPNTFTIEAPNDPTENYIQRPANLILIFAQNYTEITKGIVDMSQTMYWSVKAKFIVHTRERSELPKVFYLFWWYSSLNCIVLEYDTDDRAMKISDYTPYVAVMDDSNENQFGCWSTMNLEEMFEGDMAPYVHCNQTCSGLDFNKHSETMYIQTCLEYQTKVYDSLSNVFEDKTVDLGGYTLSLFIVHFPPLLIIDRNETGLRKFKGKDGYIVQIIGQKMNLTFKYNDPKERSSPTFQTWVAGLMDLSYRRFDYYANTVYLLPFSFPALDTTYPVEGSGLCFVVHKAGFIPTWVNLVHMFDTGALIMVIVIFNITMLIYFFFLLDTNDKKYVDALLRSFLYTLQLFLSAPVNWTDKKNSLRVFIFIVFWFIFVVNFVFQGTIVSLLTMPRTNPEINTFQELYDTGLKIEGYPSPDVLLPQTSDLYMGINKRFVANEVMFSCLNKLKHKMFKACWMDCMMIKGLERTFRDDEGRMFVHIGQDRVHSHYLVYPLSRNCPLKPRFDHYIKKMFESGLLDKWRGFKTMDASDSMTDNKKLNLDDVQGCFYILFFGYCISLIGFSIEFLVYFIHLLKHNFHVIVKKCTKFLCCNICRKNKKARFNK